MTKKQLIAENESLRKALKIVCLAPESQDAAIIRFTEKHNEIIQKWLWFGIPNVNNNKFGGILNATT